MISFKLISGTSSGPRAGILDTPHGSVETPCFMPVGTAATVKGMAPWDLKEVGAAMILANTYHLLLRPGVDVIKKLGGLHKFMAWDGPILTDSGGYQVVSLADPARGHAAGVIDLSEKGVKFRSHLDGAEMTLTPESVVATQRDLGVDIAMVLDEPVRLPAGDDEVRTAMERTLRWAERSIEARNANAPDTALFGIIQGGTDREMRAESVKQTINLGFDGYAVGGLSVGEGPEDLHRTAEFTVPMLPRDKPRYLMGVGTPADIIRAMGYGVDMFDCVLPTRNARNGWLFTSKGPIRIKHSAYKDDATPPDEDCDCRVCRSFSRSYLRHLHMAGEMLAGMLITSHNLYFYMEIVKKAREAIKDGTFTEFAKEKLEKMVNETMEDKGGGK